MYEHKIYVRMSITYTSPLYRHHICNTHNHAPSTIFELQQEIGDVQYASKALGKTHSFKEIDVQMEKVNKPFRAIKIVICAWQDQPTLRSVLKACGKCGCTHG